MMQGGFVHVECGGQVERATAYRLAHCLNRRVESLTPGEMLRAVRDCGPMARQLLARELVPDTRLFDLDFMRLVIDLCDTFLNDSAHPEGLDRRACVALRAILLDQGVLRDLLRCVQPAAAQPPIGNR